MTREDAKQLLIALGIAEPTSEQITNYLNSVNGEVQKEKDKRKDLQSKADEADELRKQLEAVNEANMSEIEKANKAKDTALSTVADLEKKIKSMEMKAKFAEKGIVGEQADKLLESLSGGSFDIDTLALIISEKETAAALAKEKEIANGNSNPNAGGNTGSDDGKDPIVANIAGRISGNPKETQSIVDSYL